MEIGDKYRVNVHKRSDQLSGDKIWTQDVINDAIKNLNLADDDLIVILQANSPQITTEIIDQCIDKTLNNNLWEVHTVDNEFIHNGAIQVIRKKVCDHKGKVNYNGFVLTNWVDVHTKNDIELLEKLI
jgi:CMP-2-keto-3-deoxyoctulosonic acid synthetase